MIYVKETRRFTGRDFLWKVLPGVKHKITVEITIEIKQI